MNATSTPDPQPSSTSPHASPVPTIEAKTEELPDAPGEDKGGSNATQPATNGVDANADSEAETEIESPVKKREAEKQQALRQRNAKTAVKSEKAQPSRIGSLPVPHEDDEDGDSTAASAFDTTDATAEKDMSTAGDEKVDEDADMMDADGSEEDSDELSPPLSEDQSSQPPSRAASEGPQQGVDGNADSRNPRKRKHRASSVSLPSSKRQSMDPPKRTRRRGLPSEDVGSMERSPSPRPRSHRRTVSTQSALDGATDASSRKRRSIATIPGRETKSAKTWEESDASSETTSRGQEERSRPQRTGGRWSSTTPGRPSGREAKRHVNKYGFTRLAEACELGHLDEVKEWRDKDPEQLEIAEFAGNTPLQIASLNGNDEIVTYLIEQGCQIDCANVDKDTPLIDAAENGHVGVVKLLLDAGVDPLRQNMKGQQALDVVTDDTEDAGPIRAALHAAIDAWNSSEAKQRREAEEEDRHKKGPGKELHFMARTYENLLYLVQNNDRNGVREFLAARVPVDNAVIAAAARTGDTYLLNMLLAEMTEKKAAQKPEKPMLGVLGSSHFEMVKALTEVENFNPLWVNRAGKSWAELAEERNGPHWRQEKELLQSLSEGRMREHRTGGLAERRSSSPIAKRNRITRNYDNSLSAVIRDDTSEEATEEEGKGKRKNGRKLMTRRDMRARSGNRALSASDEDDDEDAEGEVDDEAEASTIVDAEPMKPPDSPTTKRRLRSKSISSPGQPSTSIDPSPKGKKLRRRSSSSRIGQDLPTLNEETDATAPSSSTPDKAKQERDAADAQARIDEARRLAEQQTREAEARRVEEEAAAQLAAEVRRAAEERKAEEQRQAAALREREAAEQARKDEEERMERENRERAAEQARAAYEAEVLAALPPAVARLLDPERGVELDDDGWRDWVTMHVLPLRTVSQSRSDYTKGSWILNLQAAPLLEQSGTQLFLRSDRPGFPGSLADTWETRPMQESDWDVLDHILCRLVQNDSPTAVLNDTANDEIMSDPSFSSTSDYATDLKATAARLNAFIALRMAVRHEDCPVALRRVRWTDVQAAMRPALRSSDITFDSSFPSGALRTDDELSLLASPGDGEEDDFVGRLRRIWKGRDQDTAAKMGPECARWTEVVTVHEK